MSRKVIYNIDELVELLAGYLKTNQPKSNWFVRAGYFSESNNTTKKLKTEPLKGLNPDEYEDEELKGIIDAANGTKNKTIVNPYAGRILNLCEFSFTWNNFEPYDETSNRRKENTRNIMLSLSDEQCLEYLKSGNKSVQKKIEVYLSEHPDLTFEDLLSEPKTYANEIVFQKRYNRGEGYENLPYTPFDKYKPQKQNDNGEWTDDTENPKFGRLHLRRNINPAQKNEIFSSYVIKNNGVECIYSSKSGYKSSKYAQQLNNIMKLAKDTRNVAKKETEEILSDIGNEVEKKLAQWEKENSDYRNYLLDNIFYLSFTLDNNEKYLLVNKNLNIGGDVNVFDVLRAKKEKDESIYENNNNGTMKISENTIKRIVSETINKVLKEGIGWENDTWDTFEYLRETMGDERLCREIAGKLDEYTLKKILKVIADMYGLYDADEE